MKCFALALTGLSALALTACASLAPLWRSDGAERAGYSEQRIESNRYRVTYNGVGAAGRVADWALVRAADLTTEQGYDWFEVTQSWTDGRPGARAASAQASRSAAAVADMAAIPPRVSAWASV